MSLSDQKREHFLRPRKWEIIEGTLQVIDDDRGIWFARVTTTHNEEENKCEEKFAVIATGYGYIMLEDSMLADLGKWCAKQASLDQ